MKNRAVEAQKGLRADSTPPPACGLTKKPGLIRVKPWKKYEEKFHFPMLCLPLFSISISGNVNSTVFFKEISPNLSLIQTPNRLISRRYNLDLIKGGHAKLCHRL